MISLMTSLVPPYILLTQDTFGPLSAFSAYVQVVVHTVTASDIASARTFRTTPTTTKRDGSVSSDGEMVFLDDLLVQHAGWLRANTELSIHTDLRPTYVVGDAATLNRAVATLIEHARCNAVSAIELVVYRRDAQAVVIVRDDGPRIAVANDSRMSASGRQESAASPKPHCGLELAARIIATHGGTLSVGERGACANSVSVRLPSTRQSWRNSAAPSGISGGI